MLPYWADFWSYLGDGPTEKDWYITSIQSKDCGREEYECLLQFMTPVFEIMIRKHDDGSRWMVYQGRRRWFPYRVSKYKLRSLKRLFKTHSIPKHYLGGFIVSTDEVLGNLRDDLVSFPLAWSFKELYLCHETMPVVIRVSGHMCVDIITSDKDMATAMAEMDYPVACNVHTSFMGWSEDW